MTWIPPQAAFSINEVIRHSGIKRTRLYKGIKDGRLKIRKCGSRTIVLRGDVARWLDTTQDNIALVTLLKLSAEIAINN